jgi:hypothetical protein
VVTYVQLAHNVWDPVKRQSRAQVIHSFGRTSDPSLLRRLIVRKYICPGTVAAAPDRNGYTIRSVILGAKRIRRPVNPENTGNSTLKPTPHAHQLSNSGRGAPRVPGARAELACARLTQGHGRSLISWTLVR